MADLSIVGPPHPSGSPSVPSAPPAAPARLSWQDVCVITYGVFLTVFLIVRNTPLLAAIGVSALTMLLFVTVLALPRGIASATRYFRQLKDVVSEAGRRNRSEDER